MFERPNMLDFGSCLSESEILEKVRNGAVIRAFHNPFSVDFALYESSRATQGVWLESSAVYALQYDPRIYTTRFSWSYGPSRKCNGITTRKLRFAPRLGA